jgi:hypothetical protein
MTQLKGVVIWQVYSTLEPDDAGLRAKEVLPLNDYRKMGEVLFRRIDAIRKEIAPLSETEWIQRLVALCEAKEAELMTLWTDKWDRECNGKQVLSDLYKYLQTSIPFTDFKRKIIEEMAAVPTEKWRIVDNILERLLTGS